MAWCEANGVDYVFGLARNAAPAARSRPSCRRPAPRPRPNRQAGAALQGLHAGRRWTAGAASRRVIGKAEWTAGRGQSALHRHLAGAQPRSMRAASTRRSTAPAARWRTGSRNASSTCSPTAPRPRPCAPTSCACGSRRWPMCCSARCAASGLPHTQFAEATCGTIRLEAAEARRPGARQRPPHQDRHGLGLSVSARVRSRACPAATSGRLSRHEPDTASPHIVSPTPPKGGAGKACPKHGRDSLIKLVSKQTSAATRTLAAMNS